MRRKALRIAILVVGGLSGYAAASDLSLANALFEERDWSACILECRRMEAEGGERVEASRLRREAERAQRQTGVRSWWKWVGEWPVRGMVAFYRAAVAPAIGSRCVLEPSCSRYSLEAGRRGGWLGLPMTGDRLVREPSVVQAAARPVVDEEGRIRYADPVGDHIGIRGEGVTR